MRALGMAVLGYVCVLSAQGPRPDPRALSVHPFAGRPGGAVTMVVRGNHLGGAAAVFAPGVPARFLIEGTDPEPKDAAGGRSRTPFDLVRVRVEIDAAATPGPYLFRLVTPHGVTNELPLYISEHPVLPEPEGAHDSPDTAVPMGQPPAAFTGRLARRGETDYFAFEAQAGETVTFEVLSGLPAPGRPGGNAAGFDPSITVFEPSGSWFNPKRLNRVAFNDEPLWVVGRSLDARLIHRFARSGRYLVRIEAFTGQGGPDYSYQLRVLPGEHSRPLATPPPDWEERNFLRRLSADRLNQLAARGGKAGKAAAIETYRAGGAAEPPLFKLPGTLVGAIDAPGGAHRARFRIDAPLDLAIEVETPAAAPPLFNPIVRLLNGVGEEVATNILAGKGACTGALSKSLQAKTIVPLRDPGEYTVEVRDATADLARPDFRYRVQLRPQVPHLGQVRIAEDHVNLGPGEAKTVRVAFDREEDYRGAVAVSAEALPAGVQAMAGADFEPDKDPPLHPGKRERYQPRTERAVVVFTAAADAPATVQPQVARLVVRPVVDGKPGPVVGSREIPVMVVKKP
jgi:hypothetical protein